MREMLRTLESAHSMRPESEERLLAAAKRGDAGAFDTLVRLHRDALRRFVSRRIAAEHIDDVIQETWLAAWTNLPGYVVKAKFKTWVYAIATNKCRDQHRKATTVALDPDFSDQERDYARTDLKCAVGEALNQLCPTHREVIDLYYFEELNLPEIALVTGRNLNTVKYQFYRAHREVAVLLGEING